MRLVARCGVALTAVAILTAGLSGQTKPDFSGRWVAVSPADSAGDEMTIRQDAATLKLATPTTRGERVVTYRLDGRRRRSVVGGQSGSELVMTRASWDDRALVLEERNVDGGSQYRKKLILSVDPSGKPVLEILRISLPYSDQETAMAADFTAISRKVVFLKR